MKKCTIYTAILVDGRRIHSKTIARLRKLGSQVLRIWKDKKQKNCCYVSGYYEHHLDRLLGKPTKDKYRTKYVVNPVWIVSSDPLAISTKVSPRLRLKLERQSRSPK